MKLLAVKAFDMITAPLRPFMRRRRAPADPRKIVVLLLDHLGDVLLSTPALRRLRLLYPQATITAVTGTWGKPALKGNPDIDNALIFDAPWFRREPDGRIKGGRRLSGVVALSALLRSERPDITLDLRGDLRHIVAMAVAQLPYRVSFGITGGGNLLSLEAEFPFERHTVIRLLSLVTAIPAAPPAWAALHETDPASDPLIFQVSEASLAWADNKLRELSVEGPFVILHPGAGRQEKIWPPEKWRQLAGFFLEAGTSVLISGSREERSLVDDIMADGRPGLHSIAGETSIPEFAALVQRCLEFVGEDTGPLHLAAAMGAATVGIFGATSDPVIWGPWCKRGAVVTPDRPGAEAMDRIEPADVARTAMGLLT